MKMKKVRITLIIGLTLLFLGGCTATINKFLDLAQKKVEEKLDQKEKPKTTISVKTDMDENGNIAVWSSICDHSMSLTNNTKTIQFPCRTPFESYVQFKADQGDNIILLTNNDGLFFTKTYSYYPIIAPPPITIPKGTIIDNILMPPSGVCPDGYVPCPAHTNCLLYAT